MRTDTATVTRLSDYSSPNHLIDRVDLDIRLDGPKTRVLATLSIRANPLGEAGAPLRLDGDELVLKALSLNGEPLEADRYRAEPQSLTIDNPPPQPFTLTIETQLDPDSNTKLMGLYRSSGTYCTQCEADGFRRITYFADRPDVMAVFTTRIEARASADGECKTCVPKPRHEDEVCQLGCY